MVRLAIGSSRAFLLFMDPAELRRRTKKFAVDTIRFAKKLPQDRVNNRIAGQLTDSATSVAPGYRAVCRARSRADVIYKLGNAIEEPDESAMWLEILTEAEISPASETDPYGRRQTSSYVSWCGLARRPGPIKNRERANESPST